MAHSYEYGVVALIIIALLIISIVYLTMRSQAEANILESIEIEMNERLLHPTHVDIYPHYVQNQDVQRSEEFGARPLGPREALIVYGEIPRGYPYWGLTGYLYKLNGNLVHASVGDSISSGTIPSLTVGDGIAVVFTSNPYLYEEARMKIQKLWKTISRQPLKVMPLYIPSSMVFDDATYTLTTKVIRRKPDQPVPQFKCLHFSSPNINTKSAPMLYLRDRSTAPKEHDSLSEHAWNRAALNALDSRSYVIKREIPVGLILQDRYPQGLDIAAQLFTPSAIGGDLPNCEGFCRDITTFRTGPIKIQDDESLVVVAVDHVMSHRATYCNLTFRSHHPRDGSAVYAMYVTGDTAQRQRNKGTNVKAQMTLNNPPIRPEGERVVSIEEDIYTEPFSNLGPSPSSVLPMKVYVVEYSAGE